MIYQIGTSQTTSNFVRRLKNNPDLSPVTSVFSEWEGGVTLKHLRGNYFRESSFEVSLVFHSPFLISLPAWLILTDPCFRGECTLLISSKSLGSCYLSWLREYNTGVVHPVCHLMSIMESSYQLGSSVKGANPHWCLQVACAV